MADEISESPRKRPRLDADAVSSSGPEASSNTADAPAAATTAAAVALGLSQDEQELAVGISAYVTPHVPGFRCTVKQRYTDFLVNEITPDGRTLRLVDLGSAGRGAKGKGGSRAEKAEKRATNGAEPAPEQKDVDGSGAGREDLKATKVEEETVSHGEGNGAPNGAANGTSAGTTSDEATGPSLEEVKQKINAEFKQEDRASLVDIFGEPTTEHILDLYAAVVCHPHRKARDHRTIKSEVISEKSKRTNAHVAVRRIFASKLETSTLPEEQGVIAIRAAPPKGASGVRTSRNGGDTSPAAPNGRPGWEDLGGEYLHFTLYKENKDTMEVLYFIASQLKVPAKNFQFAGTKDRRGVTVQRVAIYRVHADRIAPLNRAAKGWRVGAFEHKPHGLDLGELDGNEFLLTLRDCRFDGDDALALPQRLELAQRVVADATAAFQQHGFLNYFGLQRFGTFATGTHTIGMKMLQNDLEGAINGILSYSDALLPENQTSEAAKAPHDDIQRADAIRQWRQTGNGHRAAQLMPRRFQAEAAIMQYLSKRDRSGHAMQDRDWQGALMQVQRSLRMMYVHAYQSRVWNTAAAHRWRAHGPRLVAGDLVVVGEKASPSDGPSAADPSNPALDQDGEPIIHPAEDDRAAPSGSGPSDDSPFERARPLSEAEAASGRFDIFDLVLPLPGYDVVYPANSTGALYESFMASTEGGGLDPHNMRRAWRDASLSGGYRRFMARPPPGSVNAQVRTYAGADEQMVLTDLERLQGGARGGEGKAAGDADAAAGDAAPAGAAAADSAADSAPAAAPAVDAAAEPAERIAVVLRLRLGRSQYATMALRELTGGGAAAFRPEYSAPNK